MNVIGELLLGQYRVTRLLGEGGMGRVYLARDEKLERDVVIKFPRHELLDETMHRRFLREIKGMVGAQQAGVVPVFNAGEHERVPFIVIPYMSGGSLEDRLLSRGQESVTEALEWLRPIAKALDGLHANHIVHRDIKPANILFDNGGVAALSDFGIAKFVGAATSQTSGLTAADMVIGSSGYIAPEVDSPWGITPAYDQYGLAVVLFEALSGQLPIVATDSREYFAKVKNEKPVRLTDLAPHVPSGVADAIERALAKDPRDRFRNCTEFAAAVASGSTESLRKPRSKALVAHDVVKRETPHAPISFSNGVGRNSAVSAAIVVLVILAAGSAGYLKVQDHLTESARAREAEILNDHRAWHEAESLATLASCRKYVADFPGGLHIRDAQKCVDVHVASELSKKRDETEWKDAHRSNTRDAYMNYLARDSNHAHRDEANQAITVLDEQEKRRVADEQATQLDEGAWNQAKTIGTNGAFQKYVQLFPRGKFVATAEAEIKSLAQAAKDDAEWAVAEKAGSAESYKKYLANFQAGRHAKQATKRIEELQDRDAWNNAEKEKTVSGYDAYLRAQANGSYRSVAADRRAALAKAAEEESSDWLLARAADTVDRYDAFLQKYPRGSKASEARERRALRIEKDKVTVVIGYTDQLPSELLQIDTSSVSPKIDDGLHSGSLRIRIDDASFTLYDRFEAWKARRDGRAPRPISYRLSKGTHKFTISNGLRFDEGVSLGDCSGTFEVQREQQRFRVRIRFAAIPSDVIRSTHIRMTFCSVDPH